MRIKFEGKSYTFPDDFSEEEITSALQSEESSSPSPQPESAVAVEPPSFPKEPPGMLSRAASAIGEMITGNERATPETQQMEDWMQMPDLGLGGGWDAFKTVAGSTFASPDEIAQMIKANLPGVGIRQDAKGNYIFKSAVDGEERAMAPGFTASDLGRASVGLPLMAMPMGKKLLQAIGIGAATQTGIEGSQALAGGSFDPAQIALAGATMGAFKGVGNVASNVTKDITNLAKTIKGPADVVGDSASPGINMVDAPLMNGEELAKTARQAAEGGFGSKKAKDALAIQSVPDAQLAQDAALVEANVSPEYLAQSNDFKRIVEAAKTSPDSVNKSNKSNSLASLATSLDNSLREVGATGNYGAKSKAVKAAVSKNISDLEAVEKIEYNELKALVPENTPIKTPAVLGYLEDKLAKNKGDMNALKSLERDVYLKLKPEAIKSADGLTITPFKTFGVFDTTMNLVGSSKTNQIYADSKGGVVKNLYSLLKQDQDALFASLGHKDKLERANSLTKLRKGFEDESKLLFGNKLAGSLSARVSKSIKGLAAGEDDDFINIMKAVPEQYRQEIATDGLRRSLGQFDKEGLLNTGGFHTFWEAAKTNPQAFTALASNLPSGLTTKLDAIARLSKAVATPVRGESIELVRQRLTRANTFGEKLFEAAENFSARAGAEVITRVANISTFGAVWAIHKLLTKKPGASFEALDKLLASPEFLATARKLATPDEKLALKKFTMSKPFKAFKGTLKNPKDLERLEETLTNAFQAASRPEREKL